MRMIFLWVFLFTALPSGVQLQAEQDVHASLPAKVLQARTVFVDNQSGYIRARDEFANELGKWERFRIVYDRSEANLVVILTAQKAQRTLTIAFVDPTTGGRIWTNSAPWSERGAGRDLLGDLRQRIEEQESH